MESGKQSAKDIDDSKSDTLTKLVMEMRMCFSFISDDTTSLICPVRDE